MLDLSLQDAPPAGSEIPRMGNLLRRKEAGVNIGRVIKAVAVLRGIPMSDLARVVGLKPAAFSRYISGTYSFNATQLEAIADAIQMKASDLFRIAEAEHDALADAIVGGEAA